MQANIGGYCLCVEGAATQARLFLKISPTIFNQGGHTASIYQAFIFQNISTDIFDARQF